MTYEEAIEILREERDWAQQLSYVNKALDMAIKALETLTPKKPSNETKSFAYCPNCCGSVFKANIKEHIENNEITFCEHCGQALVYL